MRALAMLSADLAARPRDDLDARITDPAARAALAAARQRGHQRRRRRRQHSRTR